MSSSTKNFTCQSKLIPHSLTLNSPLMESLSKTSSTAFHPVDALARTQSPYSITSSTDSHFYPFESIYIAREQGLNALLKSQTINLYFIIPISGCKVSKAAQLEDA